MPKEIYNNSNLKVNEIIDKMNLINFENIKENTHNNSIVRTYKVMLFNDNWYTYDFLVYATKCYDKFYANFVNEKHEIVTEQYIDKDFEFSAKNIQNICNNNRLKFSITLYGNNNNRKHMTISKSYDKEQITVLSTLDENGMNLDANMNGLMSNYLNWIQSEQIYSILCNSNYLELLQSNSANSEKDYINSLYSINEPLLASVYYLIQHILKLPDDEYEEYYNTNIKWIEKKSQIISSDKKFWSLFMENIGKTLISKNGIKQLAENLKYKKIIDCSCGKIIECDFRDFPQNEKEVRIRCPKCNSEYSFCKKSDLETSYTYPVSHHIFENIEMCKQENPDYESFFEETEKFAMAELENAKDDATINGIKVSEYLANAKTPDQISDIMVALGESCIYNRKFESKEDKLVYSMELDNLDSFRVLLIYNIIGILYHISNEGMPITVEISLDKEWEEVFEAFRPIMDKVKDIVKGIEEYKIIYK